MVLPPDKLDRKWWTVLECLLLSGRHGEVIPHGRELQVTWECAQSSPLAFFARCKTVRAKARARSAPSRNTA